MSGAQCIAHLPLMVAKPLWVSDKRRRRVHKNARTSDEVTSKKRIGFAYDDTSSPFAHWSLVCCKCCSESFLMRKIPP
jgi:hypothetical protein